MVTINFKQSLITSTLDKIQNKSLSAQNSKPLEAQPTKEVSDRNKLGEILAQEGNFDKAIQLYKEAIQLQPDFEQTHLNLAKVYKLKQDYPNAADSFNKYLTLKPNDGEAITLLGQVFKEQGFYTKAISEFEKATALDSQDDFAARNLKETQNYLKSAYDPRKAEIERNAAIRNNLHTAGKLAKEYLPKDFLNDMQDVTVTFDETAKLKGYANIAQYEHAKRKIAITTDFVWANPSLTGAYLTHEYYHAKDNDAFSSIREEQDAFHAQAGFWLKYGIGVKDPEMDYVASLYKESAEKLDARVRDIYLARDPQMPETSPHHPPSINSQALSNAAASNNSQPLKSYDVIA